MITRYTVGITAHVYGNHIPPTFETPVYSDSPRVKMQIKGIPQLKVLWDQSAFIGSDPPLFPLGYL